MEDKLLFLVGTPRSGSTLLARMLGANTAVHAPAEPHLLSPLAYLGYYESVERAAYDPTIVRAAIRELVGTLPRQEADYLDALRAYTDAVYGRMLESSGRRVLLDKTPAYALVLDFAARLYPKARYVVLTRNPLAVWASFVESFFDGDHEAAHRHNPLLERYVPAIARFLREPPAPLHRVRYEDLVRDPAAELQRICAFAGLDFEPGMVDYGAGGAQQDTARGLGDPITVAREQRPTTRSLARWAEDLTGQPDKIEQAGRILASLADQDLEAWGFSRAEIEEQLHAVDPSASRPGGRRPRFTRYALERRLLIVLRRNIHHNAFGRLIQRVRDLCNVLLR